jgi:hypothetical protein
MTDFHVTLRLQIHGNFSSASSRDLYVEKDFVLPFPPYSGLSVKDGEHFFSFGGTMWDTKEQRFICYSDEEDKELYEAGLHNKPTERTVEEIAQEYVDEVGWERVVR